MSPRQLPATKSKSSSLPTNLVVAIGVWFLMTGTLAYLVLLAAQRAIEGDALTATLNIGVAAFLYWRTGGFLINLPLSLYLANNLKEGQLVQTATAYKRALKLWERLRVHKDANFAVTMSGLAYIQHNRGHFDEAELYYSKAIFLLEKHKTVAYPHLAAIQNNYASLLIRQGNFLEAERLISASLSIWENQKSGEWNGSAIPLCTKASMHIEQGDLEKAEECLLHARRRFESDPKPAMIIPESLLQCQTVCYLGLTQLYCKKGQWGDAAKFMQLTLDMVQHHHIAFGPLSLYVTSNIIDEYMNANKLDQAERMLELAYQTAGKYPDHPDSVEILEHYDKLLRITNRSDEVADMRRWIRPILPKLLTEGLSQN